MPYRSPRKSRSKPGDVANVPSDGGIFTCDVYDEHGAPSGVLIEWQNNPETWIWSDYSVRLDRQQ